MLCGVYMALQNTFTDQIHKVRDGQFSFTLPTCQNMLWFLLVFTYLSSKENWFWSHEFSLFKVGLEEYWVGLGKNPSLHLGFSASYVMAALDNEWGGKPDSVLATRTLHFHLHLASYKPQFFWFSSSKKSVACTLSSGACFCGSIPLQPPPFYTFSTHQITLIKNHGACSIMLRCSYIQSINGFALFRFLFLLLLISNACK